MVILEDVAELRTHAAKIGRGVDELAAATGVAVKAVEVVEGVVDDREIGFLGQLPRLDAHVRRGVFAAQLERAPVAAQPDIGLAGPERVRRRAVLQAQGGFEVETRLQAPAQVLDALRACLRSSPDPTIGG